MPIDYQIIGAHIRTARCSKKMTQEAVSERLEMSSAYYGKVERGERMVNLQRLSQISALLDVPIELLVKGSVVSHSDHVLYDTQDMIHPAEGQKRNGFLQRMKVLTAGCSQEQLDLIYRISEVVLKPGSRRKSERPEPKE